MAHQPIKDGDYRISNVTHSSHNMAKMDVDAYAIFGNNARWTVKWDAHKANYSITHKLSDLALDLIEVPNPPKPLIVHPRHDGPNQRWKIRETDAGGYHILSVSSPGLVVAITSTQTEVQYKLYGVSENDDGLKRWQFTPA